MGCAGATNEKSLKTRVSGRELRPEPEREETNPSLEEGLESRVSSSDLVASER